MHKASSLQCIHYADDTTLLCKGNNLDDLIDFTNTELVKIDKWVCANKLSRNINKTAFSICSTKSVTDVRRVKIRNVEINLVNNFQFLGIQLAVIYHSVDTIKMYVIKLRGHRLSYPN